MEIDIFNRLIREGFSDRVSEQRLELKQHAMQPSRDKSIQAEEIVNLKVYLSCWRGTCQGRGEIK